MKVLLVKTSSLGDVIHALPAVTEALSQVDDMQIDWVVEENFRAIPEAHPGVQQVIPVAIRRWRTRRAGAWSEIKTLYKVIRSRSYDLVIDTQGLLKSSVLAKLAHGEVHGFDKDSARESIACLLYDRKHAVARDLHAITRQKQLMAASLGYQANDDIHYGLGPQGETKARIMLLHGTTWPSKEWPESAWHDLANLIRDAGYDVAAPAGSQLERDRAKRILGGEAGLLDRLSLAELMSELGQCAGVVSVDTGLGHLAPALDVPVVGIFGATSPRLTGMLGGQSRVLASTHLPCIPCRKRECQFQKPGDSSNIYPPCFEQTSPESVWQALQLLLRKKRPEPD